MVGVWLLTRYWVLMLMVVTRMRVGVAVCVVDRRDVIDTPEVMPTTRRGIHDYRSVVNGVGGGSLGMSFPTWLAFRPTHPSQQRIATKSTIFDGSLLHFLLRLPRLLLLPMLLLLLYTCTFKTKANNGTCSTART